jgi:hypothetical protein
VELKRFNKAMDDTPGQARDARDATDSMGT